MGKGAVASRKGVAASLAMAGALGVALLLHMMVCSVRDSWSTLELVENSLSPGGPAQPPLKASVDCPSGKWCGADFNATPIMYGAEISTPGTHGCCDTAQLTWPRAAMGVSFRLIGASVAKQSVEQQAAIKSALTMELPTSFGVPGSVLTMTLPEGSVTVNGSVMCDQKTGRPCGACGNCGCGGCGGCGCGKRGSHSCACCSGPSAVRTVCSCGKSSCSGRSGFRCRADALKTAFADNGTARYRCHVPLSCLIRSQGGALPKRHAWWNHPVLVQDTIPKNSSAFDAAAEKWPLHVSPSEQLGWSLDGSPIYGPYDEDELLLETPKAGVNHSKLDECHSTIGQDGVSRYHITVTFPFLPACFAPTTGQLQGTSTGALVFEGWSHHWLAIKFLAIFFLFVIRRQLRSNVIHVEPSVEDVALDEGFQVFIENFDEHWSLGPAFDVNNPCRGVLEDQEDYNSFWLQAQYDPVVP